MRWARREGVRWRRREGDQFDVELAQCFAYEWVTKGLQLHGTLLAIRARFSRFARMRTQFGRPAREFRKNTPQRGRRELRRLRRAIFALAIKRSAVLDAVALVTNRHAEPPSHCPQHVPCGPFLVSVLV